jgi:2-octaprenyl-6-methoxyphenol hydroxylase
MTQTKGGPRIAVVGAGPAGLALALLAAQRLPLASVTLYDARPADKDVSGDPRTLALSLGSVQLLQRLQAWPAASAQPITEVHISQVSATPGLAFGVRPEVRIRADEESVAMLGAVLSYGALVALMQRAWEQRCALQPHRLSSRFGVPVAALKPLPASVEIDADIAEVFELVVVAEGGVFAEQSRKALVHDYQQTAWVGTAGIARGTAGLAIERFTRYGPLALLPLLPEPDGNAKAALVWCVPTNDDPVRDLDDPQRIAILNSLLPEGAGELAWLSPLKPFALGLNAEATLVSQRTVKIGNAAQTLHPVAGQGLNLGLRDAYALVDALRRDDSIDSALRQIEWARAPDRWVMIATTDFLARSFAWQWPGMAALRATGLALLDAAGPLKSRIARQMMFGRR